MLTALSLGINGRRSRQGRLSTTLLSLESLGIVHLLGIKGCCYFSAAMRYEGNRRKGLKQIGVYITSRGFSSCMLGQVSMAFLASVMISSYFDLQHFTILHRHILRLSPSLSLRFNFQLIGSSSIPPSSTFRVPNFANLRSRLSSVPKQRTPETLDKRKPSLPFLPSFLPLLSSINVRYFSNRFLWSTTSSKALRP